MNVAIKTLSIASFAGIALFSCVPAKQYNNLKDISTKCEEERSQLGRENDSLKKQVRELSSANIVLDREKGVLLADSAKRNIQFVALSEDYTKLQDRYQALNEAHETILKGTQSETKKLLAEIQKAQTLLQIREDSLRTLEDELNARSRNLNAEKAKADSLLAGLNEKSQKILEMQSMLDQQDSIANALRQKLKNALMGFEGKGLTITQKNGMVYVSMEDKLLFKSGSFDIDNRGAEAVKQLSKVLGQNKDINIMVEGHTDNVPYQGRGELKDNWDLSVKRATTVVRLLLQDKGISPERVTGAGRSEYLPIDPAQTSEARQKNRRTEIILTPKLDELIRIIDKE